MFTMQNTEGFTQEILDKMNAKLADEIATLDQDEDNYEEWVEAISDRIFSEYCEYRY